MAGGLFAVYRDTTALPPSQSTSRRRGNSINSGANIRKKEGLNVFRDTTACSNTQLEKENLDPSNKGGKKALSSGKGKKSGMSGKSDCGNAVKSVAMGDRAVKQVQQSITRPSTNGVCTGTLRTRTLPPLPPLETEDSPISLPPSAAPLPPSISEISRPESPNRRTNSELRSIESPASNVDSGYGKLSDLDRGFDDESDMSLEVEDVEEIYKGEGNRRARALTESPLAEVSPFSLSLPASSNHTNHSDYPLRLLKLSPVSVDSPTRPTISTTYPHPHPLLYNVPNPLALVLPPQNQCQLYHPAFNLTLP